MSKATMWMRASRNSENGFTLIEVLVAMMVFAIIAIGIAYSITTTLLMTRDARSREVATNLAAQEIDFGRSTGDIFSLLDHVSTDTVGGVPYTVTRSTHWVTGGGASAQCGTGAGTLKYKRVNVSVVWQNMLSMTPPVRADTLVAPKGRINDPELGTILVSVLSASGTGVPGVTVAAEPASPANGAEELTETPAVTDSQGCSYILKVTPGNYDVTVSKPGYVDVQQHLDSSTTTVGVGAGTSTSAGFQFDQAASFTVNYAADTLVPTNLDITYSNTYGNFVTNYNPAKLHPFPAGYQVFAGAYVAPSGPNPGCVSVNPDAWTTPDEDGAVGHADAAIAALPGGGAEVTVRTGIVTISGGSGQFLTAVSAPPPAPAGTDDPGCTVPMTYTFPKLSGSSTTVVLPFGSWNLYTGNRSGRQTNQVAGSSLTVETLGKVTGSTVTLDPRMAP